MKNDEALNSTTKIYKVLKALKLRVPIEGAFIGLFSGLIVVAYRVLLGKAEYFSIKVYTFLNHNKIYIPLGLIALILVGYLVGIMVEKEPMISGSGIPQIEGLLTGYFKISPLRVLIGKFFGGILAIGAGLSLGREGPSIQLGASFGHLIGKLFKKANLESRFLITSGASAGLAAAFNAPFSGAIFSLEEVHKNFSPLVLLAAMSASVTSDFVTKIFLGHKPLFDIPGAKPLSIIPFRYYWSLVILGASLGLAGALYNLTLLKTQDLYSKVKSTRKRIIIPFIFALIFGLTFPQILGGGHGIIHQLLRAEIALKMAILLLIFKFIFSMISFCSNAPGGILFPLLVLGGLIGCIFARIGINLFGIDSTYLCSFAVISMAGMFASIVRAPITGIMLVCEMSGSFNNLLSVSLVCIVSYLVACLTGSEPIYESLLEERIKKQRGDKECPYGKENEKIFIRYIINQGSVIEGLLVKDLKLPTNSLIVSIERGIEEITPRGNTKLLRGDYIIILSSVKEETKIRDYLGPLCEELPYKP